MRASAKIDYWIDPIFKVYWPTLWVARNLRYSRWYGALPTPLETAFWLRDNLPCALVAADLWKQPTNEVSESVWRELRRDLRLIIKQQTVRRDVPVNAINEIQKSTAARKARVSHRTLISFAEAGAKYYPVMTLADLLNQALDEGEQQIPNPDSFTYEVWSGRLRWNNEDGSHRMAGAVLASRDTQTSCVIEANVAIQRLDGDVIRRINDRFAAFLLPAIGDDSSRVLPAPGTIVTGPTRSSNEDERRPYFSLLKILADAYVPYRTATIFHYEREREVVFLPHDHPRARKIAARLARSLRPPRGEVFTTLGKLADSQVLPDFLR